jgi:hypothetical protein
MTINKLLFLFAFLQALQIRGQSPYAILERPISVTIKNTPLKEALTVVSQKGRFEFSYAGRIIDTDKKITLMTNNLSIRETLIQIMGDNYTYQQKGEYLIIKKNDKAKEYISGYLSDAKTGKRIKNATVYDTKTLRSTTTDENGFYTLKVAQRSTVVVAQLAYKDTLLQVTEKTPRFVKLDLHIKPQPTQDVEKSINWGKIPNKLSSFFISSLHEFNNLNVKDSIRRRFQMSFVPYIGTNHAMSGNVSNDFSINIIAGYARSNRVLELSGVGSFIRENVSGIQGAGVFNIVKGNTKGIQMSGVFNHVNDTLRGVQWGGVWNYAKKAYSINQSAGVANVVLKGNVKTQFSGVANLADTITGAQLSGVYNYTKIANGIQVAGVLNLAKEVRGVQISGLVNQAKYIKGLQIGIVNYADSIDGLQIGLINYAKKGGYNLVEVSGNEINNINIAYKSGGRRLYTAFTVGITPKPDANIWSHGMGLGTLLKVNTKTDVNIEAMYRHINVGSYSNYLQDWLQLGLYGNFHLGNRFDLTLGPSANILLVNRTQPMAIENINKIFPAYVKPRIFNANNNIRTYGWLGANVALRVKLGRGFYK